MVFLYIRFGEGEPWRNAIIAGAGRVMNTTANNGIRMEARPLPGYNPPIMTWPGWFLLLCFAFVVGLAGYGLIRHGRCPDCRKYFAMRSVGETPPINADSYLTGFRCRYCDRQVWRLGSTASRERPLPWRTR